MAIKTVIYDPKTLKGKEKSNKVLVSKENAEGRGKIVPFFYLPHIPRFPQFMACSTPQLLNSNQNLIMINFGIDALVIIN
jgi:hypothetical protein